MKMLNPLFALRDQARSLFPGAMVRYDQAASSLLISDAKRHGFSLPENAPAFMNVYESTGLFRIDLAPSEYAALLEKPFSPTKGPFVDEWFVEQALLASILRHSIAENIPSLPDLPLLRRAMIASALGPASLRLFLRELRAIHAEKLRVSNTISLRTAAALCADALQNSLRIGLPPAHSCAILSPAKTVSKTRE